MQGRRFPGNSVAGLIAKSAGFPLAFAALSSIAVVCYVLYAINERLGLDARLKLIDISGHLPSHGRKGATLSLVAR